MEQNYMTNKLIKKEVDKNQKGYVETEEEEQIDNTIECEFDVIANEEDYNRLLADENSVLNKYYTKYPREDGIDAEGNPVLDPNTEVVGHSWESAMHQPTDPAQTSSFPWILLNLKGFKGTAEVKYEGEVKFTRTWTTERQYAIFSVPNNLGLEDCRLEWGTGMEGKLPFHKENLEITLTPSTE